MLLFRRFWRTDSWKAFPKGLYAKDSVDKFDICMKRSSSEEKVYEKIS